MTHQHHLLDRVEIGHSSPLLHVLQDILLFEKFERIVLRDVLVNAAFEKLLRRSRDHHGEDVIWHTY